MKVTFAQKNEEMELMQVYLNETITIRMTEMDAVVAEQSRQGILVQEVHLLLEIIV